LPGKTSFPGGAEAGECQLLFDVGTRLTPTGIAVAASAGYSTVTVFPPPASRGARHGRELVPVTPSRSHPDFATPTCIRCRHRWSWAGGEAVPCRLQPIILAVARVDRGRLCSTISALFSGGVSMGKYDLVEDALKEFQAEFYFTGARIQPGKPVVFGEAEAPVKPRRTRSGRRASLWKCAVCLFSVCRGTRYRRSSPYLNCRHTGGCGRSLEANPLPCCSLGAAENRVAYACRTHAVSAARWSGEPEASRWNI